MNQTAKLQRLAKRHSTRVGDATRAMHPYTLATAACLALGRSSERIQADTLLAHASGDFSAQTRSGARRDATPSFEPFRDRRTITAAMPAGRAVAERSA